jgi:hypothetical protein
VWFGTVTYSGEGMPARDAGSGKMMLSGEKHRGDARTTAFFPESSDPKHSH